MNKQYVKEQIDIAVSELRKEYDAIIGNIYQCADCGALAFKNSEHICLGARPEPQQAVAPKSRRLVDYVMAALPTIPPEDPFAMFEHSSPWLPTGIGQKVGEMGYEGKITSVGPALADLLHQNKIKAMAVTIKEMGTRGTKRFPRTVAGFAYWRPS